MSRAVRRQLFETIDILKEATGTIAELIEAARADDLIQMLTDCQDAAIAIGTQIDNIYEENLDCVHSLEKYCELLFALSEGIDNQENCKKIHSQLMKCVLEAKEKMQKELPDKLEVVFFPYKASMWDSLESLYLRAREDENCEAYVVPIPYFNRKPDRSLGNMYYEGDMYPQEIEITDWEQYNFEERKPDVVFVHNPYDNSNSATCVHPRFFCKNLKQYTDKLVYVPYFVLAETDPDNQEQVDWMKHFCFLPGTIYAHKVILQSEKMSQIYVNEYAKAAESAGLKGEHTDKEKLRQKFLGLGSPKFDKVLNTKQEDLDIPKEWLKIITKPDGSRKKVIFYNTTVAALLYRNEKLLEKMKYVLEEFKGKQDEIALLWRPHPLFKQTIEAMRPQLLAEYEELVETYLSEGWGIFDDTVDLNRAIVLCDMYYGDPSSIVELVKVCNKKVVMQNVFSHDDLRLVEAQIDNSR